VPVVAKPEVAAWDLAFQPTASADAVVALRSLAPLEPAQRALAVAEAMRVLKPGRPLIFVERLSSGGPLAVLLGGGPALEPAALEAALEAGAGAAAGLVRWDVALEALDPHAVGLVMRSDAPASSSGGGGGGGSSGKGGGGGAGGRRAGGGGGGGGFGRTAA